MLNCSQGSTINNMLQNLDYIEEPKGISSISHPLLENTDSPKQVATLRTSPGIWQVISRVRWPYFNEPKLSENTAYE